MGHAAARGVVDAAEAVASATGADRAIVHPVRNALEDACSRIGADRAVRRLTAGKRPGELMMDAGEQLDGHALEATSKAVEKCAGWGLVDRSGWTFSRDLDGRVTAKELSTFADRVYSDYQHSPGDCWVIGKDRAAMVAKIYTSDKGYRCMAFMGTVTGMQVFLNFFLVAPWSSQVLTPMVEAAVSEARKHEVTHVTGHSQGGFLAECVAWRGGFSGAAINGPGGRGGAAIKAKDCSHLQFEVHLAKGDIISEFNRALHIANPKWHDHGAGTSPNQRHKKRRLD